MDRCFNCGYMCADRDEEGVPISNEYCHYDGPDAWAPCEQDNIYDEAAEEAAYWESIEHEYYSEENYDPDWIF